MRVAILKSHPPPVLDACEREAVMVCAGECVREEEVERRRRETRAELVKQLEELQLSERKDLMKVSHQWSPAVLQSGKSVPFNSSPPS